MTLILLAQVAEAYRYGDFARRVETRRCAIHTNYAETEAVARGRFYDAFFDWFEERYYRIEQKQPLTVYLFDNTKDFAWYRDHVGTDPEAASFYVQSQNLAAIDGTLGPGVAAHELAHHFMHVGFGGSPAPCVSEGFASFFESFAGYLDDDGRLTLSVGYFHLSRLQGAKWEFEKEPDLESLMKGEKADYPLSLALMLYLNRKGLFRNYVLALREAKNDAHGIRTLEAVTGRPLEEIEEEWKDLTHALSLGSNLALPIMGAVYESREEWDDWIESNRFRFQWDAERGAWDIERRRHERIERPVAESSRWDGWRNRQATPHVVIYTDLTIPELAPIKTAFDRFHEWLEATGFPMGDEYIRTVFVMRKPDADRPGVAVVDASAGHAAAARRLLRAWAEAAAVDTIDGEAELFADPLAEWLEKSGQGLRWNAETSRFER